MCVCVCVCVSMCVCVSIRVYVYYHVSTGTHDNPIVPSTQDYPSVSQIYSLLVRENIVPIFSCTSDYLPRYEDLAKEIPGARAAELTRNSNNLLQIIRDEYNVSGHHM